MKITRLLPNLFIALALLMGATTFAQTTVTIGTGTSSSATRGPLQRSDTNSSSVYSRNVLIYTAAELATAGIPSGATIQTLSWDRSNSNSIAGTGNANLKIYLKNSSATAATSDSWSNLITGSTLVHDVNYNTTNNFPTTSGWVQFSLSTPFIYTGGALEVAVDWDCSAVSSPVFSGNGSINWRYSDTAPDTLLVQRVGSSSTPTTIDVKKDERANIQIEYTAIACGLPNNLNASGLTDSSAMINWAVGANAASYFWKVVAAGTGSSSAAVDSGTVTVTSASVVGLSDLTSYDLYVEADCGTIGNSGFAGPYTFMTLPTVEDSVTIGIGTSSSSTRGPFQRSDTASSTVYSRFNHVYTAAELVAAGITNGTTITALRWDLASDNTIIGTGNANLKVYVKNSTAATATTDTWANLITGSALVVDNNYNTTNNFPGANGWMTFSFTAPFIYTGGSIEIGVDWDCSQVTTPAFSGDGSLKWRWDATTPTDLVAKNTSSSGPSTTISNLSDERANIQMVYAVTTCAPTNGLSASGITSNSANFHWNPALASNSYEWKVVPAGAGSGAAAVDSGIVTDTNATSTLLVPGASYDLYVESDCGGIGTSGFAGPFNFSTLCANTPATAITTTITDASCNGVDDGEIDVTVTAGIAPYTFLWSNAAVTEDVFGLGAGEYFMTITDGNGCPYFDSAVVAEPAVLALTSSSVPDTNMSGAGSAAVTAVGGTPPYTYEWDGSVGSSDSLGLAAGTYSVAVVDANGCTETISVTVDDVVGISLIDNINSLIISPNPSHGMAKIDLQLNEIATVTIDLYALDGSLISNVVSDKTSQLSESIDLTSCAEGVYFVRFSINNMSITKKLIILN